MPGASAREAQIRSVLGWSPKDYKRAVSVADAGDMSLAADLWETVWTTDDRVNATIETRVSQLVGSKLSFELTPPGEKRRGGPSAATVGAAVATIEEDWWDIFDETELKRLIGWYLGLNIALAELVWTEPDPITGEEIARIRNGRNVPRAKVWHPRALRYDWDERCWYVRLHNGEEIKVRNGDGRFILFLGGQSRPWAYGLWRALALLYLLKVDAQVDWGRHNEKYANGIIVVDGDSGSDDSLREEVANDIVDLGAEGVIALPIGFKASVMQTDATAYETFKAREDGTNTSIAIVVLGGNLATESKDGADTGATVQAANQNHRLRGDAEVASTVLREGALGPWALANHGTRDAAPWPLWHTEPAINMASLASTIKTVFDAIRVAHETSAPLDVRALMKKFEVPIDETASGGDLPPIFAYHIAAGIPTKNEVRARLKLPAVAGGEAFTSAPSNLQDTQGAQAA